MTTEEIKKQNEQANEASASQSRADQIGAMYDAQKEANLLQLETAYKQNLSDAQAARDKLPTQYQQSANDLAVQYERNRRNFNQQAVSSGLNTGTASQAQLSRSNEYLRDFGKLRSSEAEAMAEADRGINDLTTQYQSAIAQAAAESDYRKAAALLEEYNNQYSRDAAKAQQLAQFGDFSAYATLYGQDSADNMFAVWKAQNPDLAYNTGKITAEEYRAMTGSYPPGYTRPSSGGGAYYYTKPNKPGTDDGTGGTDDEPTPPSTISRGEAYNTAKQIANTKGATAAGYYLTALVNAGKLSASAADNVASKLK
jgi:hypothetical protein